MSFPFLFFIQVTGVTGTYELPDVTGYPTQVICGRTQNLTAYVQVFARAHTCRPSWLL